MNTNAKWLQLVEAWRKKIDLSISQLLDINKLNSTIAEPSVGQGFYVIGHEQQQATGLFGHVLHKMIHVLYALSAGLTPIVDMQNYDSIYLEDGEIGKVNAWEKFFLQPFGHGLESITEPIQPMVNLWPSENIPLFLFNKHENYDKYFKVIATIYSNYLKLNETTEKHINEEYNRLIKPDMRVLGVYCRGTDYKKMKPSFHPIQPEVEDVIEYVRTALADWDCSHIFLTTDERKTYELFEAAYPGRVLRSTGMFYDDAQADYSSQYVGLTKFDRANDVYLKGLEYLTSVMIFARCTSAVMGMCAGSMAATYINGGKFENLYVYDLGAYE